MKRLVATAVLVLMICGSISAQQTSDIHQQTTAPAGARFEIVQSEIAARWTFRLDRFTGHVSQLVTPADGRSAWENMVVIDLPPASAPSHAKFQIFTSGISARHTFLIDVETGKTWVIVSNKTTDKDGHEEEYFLWEPFSS